MAVSDADIAFVTDLFSEIGPITYRKMFGGLGIYADGVIFALLMSDGRMMLKGAGDMQDAYDAAGWDRWVYERKGGAQGSMPYWQVPDDFRDDPELACDWARRALAAL